MTNEVIEFPRAVPTWTLEDKLRKARLHAGYDQTQLAAALGMSRGIVSNYERGVGEPQRDTVLLWAVECGVSIEWLMGDHFEVVPNSRFHSLIQGPAGSESEGWEFESLRARHTPFWHPCQGLAPVVKLTDYRPRVAS